jgi:hypothetical protein
MPTYRIHDTTGDDFGLIEHPAPNVEPGDVVVLADGREALVTARVGTDRSRLGQGAHVGTESCVGGVIRFREVPSDRMTQMPLGLT